MELARLLSTLVCGRGRIILVYFWRFRLLSCEILPTLQSGVLSAATLTVNFENRIITAATNIVQFFFAFVWKRRVKEELRRNATYTLFFRRVCATLVPQSGLQELLLRACRPRAGDGVAWGAKDQTYTAFRQTNAGPR